MPHLQDSLETEMLRDILTEELGARPDTKTPSGGRVTADQSVSEILDMLAVQMGLPVEEALMQMIFLFAEEMLPGFQRGRFGLRRGGQGNLVGPGGQAAPSGGGGGGGVLPGKSPPAERNV